MVGGCMCVCFLAMLAFQQQPAAPEGHPSVGNVLAILGEDGKPLVGTSTAGMPADNPDTGHTFARLIQMSYECVEELKRALRGVPKRDYDAETKVSFIETMILHVVQSVHAEDEIPLPQPRPRGATFYAAYAKVKLFNKLVKQLPDQGYFRIRTSRDVRYSILRYDLIQIAQALQRVVTALHARHFHATEPNVPNYVMDQRRIEAGVDSAVSQPAVQWDHVGIKVQQHLDEGMPRKASEMPPLMISKAGENVPLANYRRQHSIPLVYHPPRGAAPHVVAAPPPAPPPPPPPPPPAQASPQRAQQSEKQSEPLMFVGHKLADGELRGRIVPLNEMESGNNAAGQDVVLQPQ